VKILAIDAYPIPSSVHVCVVEGRHVDLSVFEGTIPRAPNEKDRRRIV